MPQPDQIISPDPRGIYELTTGKIRRRRGVPLDAPPMQGLEPGLVEVVGVNRGQPIAGEDYDPATQRVSRTPSTPDGTPIENREPAYDPEPFSPETAPFATLYRTWTITDRPAQPPQSQYTRFYDQIRGSGTTWQGRGAALPDRPTAIWAADAADLAELATDESAQTDRNVYRFILTIYKPAGNDLANLTPEQVAEIDPLLAANNLPSVQELIDEANQARANRSKRRG